MSRKCLWISLKETTDYREVQCKVYRDTETHEFVARFYINGILRELSDYFGDSLDDAVGAGIATLDYMGAN